MAIILTEVENQVQELLGAMVTAGTLKSLESYSIYNDETLAKAIQMLRAKVPAGILSQPEVQINEPDTGLPQWNVNFMFVAITTGRGDREERRIDETKGTYKIYQDAYVALKGKTLEVPHMTATHTQPVRITQIQFGSEEKYDFVSFLINITLRAELISDNYQP